jgi:hypothetical protein
MFVCLVIAICNSNSDFLSFLNIASVDGHFLTRGSHRRSAEMLLERYAHSGFPYSECLY